MTPYLGLFFCFFLNCWFAYWVSGKVSDCCSFWCFCVPPGAGSKTKHGCLCRVLQCGRGVSNSCHQLGKQINCGLFHVFQACFYQSATVAATVGIDEIAIYHSVCGNISVQLFHLCKEPAFPKGVCVLKKSRFAL